MNYDQLIPHHPINSIYWISEIQWFDFTSTCMHTMTVYSGLISDDIIIIFHHSKCNIQCIQYDYMYLESDRGLNYR